MVYVPGDHKAVCDICGFTRLRSEMRMNYNKMFVCADTCWEPRHEQYIEPTGRHERQHVDISRPESDPVFITDPITPDDL